MPVIAQTSVVSFAPQATAVGDGTFNHSSYQWQKVRVISDNLGAQIRQQEFPPEIGGLNVLSAEYRDMLVAGGMLGFIPRFERSFGNILYGLMGDVSTVANKDADGATATGAYTHIFKFGSTAYNLPFMAFRRMIDHTNPANVLGETIYDAVIGGMQLQMPAVGKGAAQIQVIGRRTRKDRNVKSTWTYVNSTFEDPTTTPDAYLSDVKIGSQVMDKAVQLSFNFTNGVNAERLMHMGSIYADGFIAEQRALTTQLVYRYEDPDYYQKVLTGSVSGTAPMPEVFEEITSGGTFALSANLRTGRQIASSGTNYNLRIRANRVSWQVGSLDLGAGNLVFVTLVGKAVLPTSGEFAEFLLTNAQTSYP